MNKYTLISVIILICIVLVIGIYLLLSPLNSQNKPNTMKESEIIKLPEPYYVSNTSVEKALKERRSKRSYRNEPLTLKEVSQILWAAQGITEANEFRTSPSAGALYPLELYVVAGNVNDLPDGIYRYKPHENELAMVVTGDKRAELFSLALYQPSIKNAPAVIVFSAVYERTTKKYGERGIRYVHMEVGHAAQNIYLQAVSLNLGTVAIGAFDDEDVKKLLKMGDKEVPLYIMPIGKI